MKSYFSQLVKHSAIRYTKENTASPVWHKAKKSEIEAPLERDEIVFVSPVAAKNETPETAEQILPQMTESTQKSSVEFFENEALKPPSPVEKPNAINQENVSPVKDQSDAFFESENIESEKLNPQKPLGVEQIVFKENEAVEAKSADSPGLQNVYPLEIGDEPKDKAAEEKRAEPGFFNKTAEMLESEMTDKFEVQKILLQEINEWVSAVPALSEAEAQPIFTTIENKASVERDAASSKLQEQNFNLSIGTITVVVEEADNQPKITTNETRNLEKSESEKRGFSRLSRYYL